MGKHRWPFRTTAEFLAAAKELNRGLDRADCAMVAYIEAHLDDPVEDVVDYIYADPEFGPQMICEGIVNSKDWAQYPRHSLEQAIADQEDFAKGLSQHDYATARHSVEPMMKARGTVFLSRAALETVLAYIKAGHPNPKAFLMKPDVLAKVPADLDLTDYPCADFQFLAEVPVRGTAP